MRLKFDSFPAYTKMWEGGGKLFVGILFFVSFVFFSPKKGREGGVDGLMVERERGGGGGIRGH